MRKQHFIIISTILFISSTLPVASVQAACLTDNNSVVTSTCDVGIGTTTPAARLDVKDVSSSDVMLRVWNNGTGGAKQRFVSADGQDGRYQITHLSSWTAEIAGRNAPANADGNFLQFRVRGTNDISSEAGLAAAAKMTILGNGSVGIGTTSPSFKLHVIGNAHVQGTLTGTNITAHYQDIAEWVPATENLSPGTVVVLNTEAVNQVMSSRQAYDTRVAGVVSGQPGITLGIGGADKEQIATTGRVLVHVDASKAPIGVGDLLVTSDIPGVAMRSEPMQISGRTFHQPGTIIGKALQPLKSGRGSILVLLSMQ